MPHCDCNNSVFGYNGFVHVTGKWLGSRQIRCNWAAKGATNDEKQGSDSKSVVELTNGTSGELIIFKYFYQYDP